MFRQFLLPLLMVTGSTLASSGCRSCQSCHDYDPPVADCQCDCCGGQRTGSAVGAGYARAHGNIVDNSGPTIVEEVE